MSKSEQESWLPMTSSKDPDIAGFVTGANPKTNGGFAA
jgi:hypothetical protein